MCIYINIYVLCKQFLYSPFFYSHSSTLKIKDTKKHCRHDKQVYIAKTLINIAYTPAHICKHNGGISDPFFEMSC